MLYLLSGNTAAIFAVLYTSLMALPVPFAPVQLLFINLLTDSLPALAIGMEPADEGLLKEKPRDPKEGLMTKDFMIQMAAQGVLIAAVVITAFYLGLRSSAAMASTMAFSTLTLQDCSTDLTAGERNPFLNWALAPILTVFTLSEQVLCF